MNDVWTVTVAYRDIEGAERVCSGQISGVSMRKSYVDPDVQIIWQAGRCYKEVAAQGKKAREDEVLHASVLSTRT